MASINFYVEQFSKISDAGIRSAAAIAEAKTFVRRINLRTIETAADGFSQGIDSVQFRNELAKELEITTNFVNAEAFDTESLVDAYKGLFAFVNENEGRSLDSYLEENNLLASQTFADVSASVGETISSDNIV